MLTQLAPCRQTQAREWVTKILKAEKSLDNFTRSFERLGLNVVDGGIVYREWAPGVLYAALVGEFS